MLVSPCPALVMCHVVRCLHCVLCVLCQLGQDMVKLLCLVVVNDPFTEVLYREGDVGHDCLCLKVPRSQGDPFTAISLGSMEVTWRRE